MLTLPNVTLCCVDTANHALALRALSRSRNGVLFARALFVTDSPPTETEVPPGVETR